MSDAFDRQIQILLGPGLTRTVEKLTAQQLRVWLVKPVPACAMSVPAAVARARRYGLNTDDIALARADYLNTSAIALEAIEKRTKAAPLVGRIALVDDLCPVAEMPASSTMQDISSTATTII